MYMGVAASFRGEFLLSVFVQVNIDTKLNLMPQSRTRYAGTSSLSELAIEVASFTVSALLHSSSCSNSKWRAKLNEAV